MSQAKKPDPQPNEANRFYLESTIIKGSIWVELFFNPGRRKRVNESML